MGAANSSLCSLQRSLPRAAAAAATAVVTAVSAAGVHCDGAGAGAAHADVMTTTQVQLLRDQDRANSGKTGSDDSIGGASSVSANTSASSSNSSADRTGGVGDGVSQPAGVDRTGSVGSGGVSPPAGVPLANGVAGDPLAWRLPLLRTHGIGAAAAAAVVAEAYRDLDMTVGIESGAELTEDEDDAIDASGGHSAYGEVAVAETERLVALAAWAAGPRGLPGGWELHDLGSGVGKLVVHAWLLRPEGCARVVGVELAEPRHGAAVVAMRRLAALGAPLGGPGPSLHLERSDMAAADLSNATVVYLASLCFDEAFMDRLVSF